MQRPSWRSSSKHMSLQGTSHIQTTNKRGKIQDTRLGLSPVPHVTLAQMLWYIMGTSILACTVQGSEKLRHLIISPQKINSSGGSWTLICCTACVWYFSASSVCQGIYEVKFTSSCGNLVRHLTPNCQRRQLKFRERRQLAQDHIDEWGVGKV